MAQEGDTSDMPWACVQLYQQLLCGSAPAPSTSLLEMLLQVNIRDLPTLCGREGWVTQLYHGF